MREHKKWWQSLHPKTNAHTYCDDCNGYDVGAKAGWRAALECVLMKASGYGEGSHISGEGCDVTGFIREELDS